MKKLLALLIVLAIAVSAFAACTPTETPDDVVYDVAGAVAYVDALYREDLTITAVDFTVVSQVIVGGVTYQVEWSVDTDKVTVGDPANGVVLIGVDEKSPEEVVYKLTATVKADDGTSETVGFKLTVPKYNVNSHADYMAAQKGDTLTVEGIVVAINSKKAGNKYNHLFLADASVTGGYYCYSVTEDPADLGIEVGMTVAVTGPMEPYSGMQEIKGGQVAIVDNTIKTVDVLDITAEFTAGANLGAFVGLPVVVKGVTIGTQDLEKDTSQYLYFAIGENQGYLRTYVTDFPTTIKADDKGTIDADHAAHFGYTADVTGILILYNGAPYLIPMSTTPFTNYAFVEKTAAEKVATEKEELSVVEAVTEDATITLPTVGNFYDDVTISWTVDNDAYVIENGELAITLGDAKVVLTLTATLTCGDTTDTQTFTVKVDAASKAVYISKPETAPQDNVAYKFALNQVSIGKTLYLTGEVSGRYLVTTNKADQAVDVFVETVDGGYKFYIVVDDAKQYITVYNNAEGKLSVNYDAAGTSVYVYNAEVNAWVTTMEGTDYYLGTYSTYDTVSASKTSYINAENTGVSQFPAGFATLAPATYVLAPDTAPVAGTAYKFALNQANTGKTLYITGEVSGRYLAMTDKVDQAVDVFVETVDGGLKFYIVVDDVKQYITVYNNAEGKLSVNFDAAGTSVYTYNASTNAWETVMNGDDYYLGTYSTYETVSASKISYITADNTGVSQFPAGFVSLQLAEVAAVAKTEPVADTAYKFALNQVSIGKTLYVTGEVSGRYLVTTTKADQAADVYAEAVDGGYKFYIVVDDAKQYITVYNNAEGKLSVNFDAAGTSVYVYNAEVNAWVTTMEGTDYYLGTYSTYDTVSASKTSYINAENTGVSQFPAGLVAFEIVD